MRIKIISEHTSTVKHYELEIGPRTYYYKEHLNESGKVIDEELMDEEGTVHTNEGLLQHIHEAIDRQISQR